MNSYPNWGKRRAKIDYRNKKRDTGGINQFYRKMLQAGLWQHIWKHRDNFLVKYKLPELIQEAWKTWKDQLL